nr:unnamed protein product [Digitaria exilis]
MASPEKTSKSGTWFFTMETSTATFSSFLSLHGGANGTTGVVSSVDDASAVGDGHHGGGARLPPMRGVWSETSSPAAKGKAVVAMTGTAAELGCAVVTVSWEEG